MCIVASLPMMAQRDTLSLNFGWTFSRDSLFTDAVTVDLPHDFQILQPWVAPVAGEKADSQDAAANTSSRLSARGFKAMGCGWYERKISVKDEILKKSRVILDFEGIMLVGDVWINGEHIGQTDYGYVGFECDITKRLLPEQDNVLRVKASTQQPDNSRWYTGGGLYRGVRLITTPRNHYFARHPLHITTRDNREVCIKAEIYYADKQTSHLNLRTRIIDAEGRVVAEQMSHPAYYRMQRQAEYTLAPVTIGQPRLWSPDTPYLYMAEVTLLDAEGNPLDQVTERFGIRTVETGPDFGLRLNGKKLLLKGWANHHSLGPLGAAAYPRAIEKRLRLMKDYGFNHVRTSHNPYSEDFYRLCDEIGLLVVDELYDKWTKQYAGGRRDWTELWQHDVPEWVRRDRNHPSVVMWSLGNELQQMSNLPYNDWGVTAYRLQRQLLMRYDSTRQVTVAMHPRYRDLSTDSLPAPLARATDVQSYNYRYMYFPGDRRRFPWMTFYQSEANMTGLPGNYYEMDLQRVIGLAYWGAMSYYGESRSWPLKGWDDSFFDITLQPKPLAGLIKSIFMPDEPLVQLAIVDIKANETEWNGIRFSNDVTSQHWNRQAGERLTVCAYTNADEAELIVNGRSMGRQDNPKGDPRHRNILKWNDVAYEPGYIELRGYNSGKLVARQRSETAGPVASLRIEGDNSQWKADGMDLQHVTITAVDKKGRIVPTATLDVALTVSGEGRLVAVGNGDMTAGDTAGQQHIHLCQGRALAIMRSSQQPGRVTMTATMQKLKATAGWTTKTNEDRR